MGQGSSSAGAQEESGANDRRGWGAGVGADAGAGAGEEAREDTAGSVKSVVRRPRSLMVSLWGLAFCSSCGMLR